MPRWTMKPKIKTALPLAMVLILWQLASMAVSPLFVPSPASVLDGFVSLLTNGQLVYGLVYSFGALQPPACLPLQSVCPSVCWSFTRLRLRQ